MALPRTLFEPVLPNAYIPPNVVLVLPSSHNSNILNMAHFEEKQDLKNDDIHIESLPSGHNEGVISKDYNTYIHDASEAVQGQKESSVIEALKKYRWGVLYSIVFSA
jgi:hypothetical protein